MNFLPELALILQISISQVDGIIGVNHHAEPIRSSDMER
jgi:hypothetical protein